MGRGIHIHGISSFVSWVFGWTMGWCMRFIRFQASNAGTKYDEKIRDLTQRIEDLVQEVWREPVVIALVLSSHLVCVFSGREAWESRKS